MHMQSICVAIKPIFGSILIAVSVVVFLNSLISYLPGRGAPVRGRGSTTPSRGAATTAAKVPAGGARGKTSPTKPAGTPGRGARGGSTTAASKTAGILYTVFFTVLLSMVKEDLLRHNFLKALQEVMDWRYLKHELPHQSVIAKIRIIFYCLERLQIEKKKKKIC